MLEQPRRGALKKLTLYRVKILESRGQLDTHDGRWKFSGSRQDLYLDKETGEIWIAGKHNPTHFDPAHINPRKAGIPGF